jgi:signal transduction histidine kinase/CheY-like chemotaxis protein
MTRKDGSRVLINHSASAIIEDGKMIGQVGTAEDITERKRLEAQYLQAQKMEGIGRLAGGVAHDFSNLMTAIMVNAELDLQTPPDPAVLREDLQDIRETAERAAGLAQQLLAFSRRQMIEPRVVSINDLVRRAQRMLGRLVDERVAIELRLTEEGCAAEVDPHQLEQVLVNLVVNARDAMPDGGTITIETTRRRVEAASPELDPLRTGDHVVLSVTDTGVGVPHEMRAQLFEPFFTTKDVGKGTGLGLSTCYGIVKQAGGHITVGGEPGEGAVFTIYLPAVTAAAVEREPDELPADLPGGRETLLLVEDEPSLRRLAARVLDHLGYEVLTASDGEDALRVAGERDGCIDLVITDVVMPSMDGHDLARRLARQRPGTRVLYMSGYTDDAGVRASMADGTIDFLPKPFSPASLARKVREILDRQPSLTTNS